MPRTTENEEKEVKKVLSIHPHFYARVPCLHLIHKIVVCKDFAFYSWHVLQAALCLTTLGSCNYLRHLQFITLKCGCTLRVILNNYLRKIYKINQKQNLPKQIRSFSEKEKMSHTTQFVIIIYQFQNGYNYHTI